MNLSTSAKVAISCVAALAMLVAAYFLFGVLGFIILSVVVGIPALILLALFYFFDVFKPAFYAIPKPAEMTKLRELYNHANLSTSGKSNDEFSAALSSSLVHPLEAMDHIASLLMYCNKNTKFSNNQICILATSWAFRMVQCCTDVKYPGLGTKIKPRTLNRELAIGSVYNGMYRATQVEFNASDEVEWLLANDCAHSYTLHICQLFLDEPSLFLRSADNTEQILAKLKHYLHSKMVQE